MTLETTKIWIGGQITTRTNGYVDGRTDRQQTNIQANRQMNTKTNRRAENFKCVHLSCSLFSYATSRVPCSSPCWRAENFTIHTVGRDPQTLNKTLVETDPCDNKYQTEWCR